MNDDITFDELFVAPKFYVVRHTEWKYVFSGDTELWADGFYHPIYVPYCKVEFFMTHDLPNDEFDDIMF